MESRTTNQSNESESSAGEDPESNIGIDVHTHDQNKALNNLFLIHSNSQ